MIRLSLLILLLASPAFGQTPLTDRPGRWLGAPALPEGAPSSDEQPEAIEAAPALRDREAPRASDTAAPTGSSGAVLPSSPGASSGPRPQPRPASIAALAPLEVIEAPDIALNVAEPTIQALVPIAPEPEPETGAVLEEPGASAPVIIATPPQTRPQPRPIAPHSETAEIPEPVRAEPVVEDSAAPTIAPDEAQAARLDAAAPTPWPVPGSEPREASNVVSRALVSETSVPEAEGQPHLAAVPLPQDLVRRDLVEPLAWATPPGLPSSAIAPDGLALALPGPRDAARPVILRVAVARPLPDRIPLLPGPLGEEPSVAWAPTAPRAPSVATLSSVLLPAPLDIVTDRPAHLTFAAAPALDRFPQSALPPGALPEGPPARDRVLAPETVAFQTTASVQLPPPRTASDPLAPFTGLIVPERDLPPDDPEARRDLPAPDPNAIARLVEETAICWRLASLGAEARWAEISLAVALDETNQASAPSIALTGFGRVMSDAAREAHHAAQAALIGCASASNADPVTAPVTLVFNRQGVRLQ